MKYNVEHDNLLDTMLLSYLLYCVKDTSLTPEQVWVRVCDAMQHLSQQAIAEFIMSHLNHESSYLRIWNLRQDMWKEKEEQEDLAPPPEPTEEEQEEQEHNEYLWLCAMAKADEDGNV